MLQIRKEGDGYVKRFVIIFDHNCRRFIRIMADARTGRTGAAQT